MQYYQVVQGILSIPTNVLFEQQVCWFLKSVFLCKVSAGVVWIFQFLEFLGSRDWVFPWWSLLFPAGDSNSRGWNSNSIGSGWWFPFHIWDVILPIDELICFKMGTLHHQPGIVVDMGWDGCGNAEIRSRWLKPKRNGAVAATCGRSQCRDAGRHAELSRWCHGYGLEWMFMGINLSEWELIWVYGSWFEWMDYMGVIGNSWDFDGELPEGKRLHRCGKPMGKHTRKMSYKWWILMFDIELLVYRVYSQSTIEFTKLTCVNLATVTIKSN